MVWLLYFYKSQRTTPHRSFEPGRSRNILALPRNRLALHVSVYRTTPLALARGPFSALVVHPAPTFEFFWGQPRIRPYRRPAELSLSLSSLKNFSFQEVQSSNHNSRLMHSLNANTTTLRLVWEGSTLIARRVLSLETLLQPNLSNTPPSPQSYNSTYTREDLLFQRISTPPATQAKAPLKLMSRQDLLTTPPVNANIRPKQCSRTGRRIELRVQGFTFS